MNVLLLLIPVSLMLGLIGLGFCVWTVRSDQYRDPEGDARRILDTRYDAPRQNPRRMNEKPHRGNVEHYKNGNYIQSSLFLICKWPSR